MGANTKKDREAMLPKTLFTTKAKKVGDTNIGLVDMLTVRRQLLDDKTLATRRVVKCGIVHAAAFPLTLPCYELVLECASRFDIGSRSITFENGKKVLANVSERVVEEVFNIPKQQRAVVVTMDQAAQFYNDNQDDYFNLLKQKWLRDGRKGVSKITKLYRHDFKQEYGDLVVLLNRVMGQPEGLSFGTWMYYFIDEIENGKVKFDWSGIISRNLELQLGTFPIKKQFYMSSYLFYIIARLYQCPGLKAKGVVGNGPGQYLVHECYPQLHSHNTKDYKMFYDAFAMRLVRILQGTPAKRLSLEAEKHIKKYGSWFIQFPQFTYIRAAGSTVCPKRLPRFPTDKIVLIELMRQLGHYENLMRQRGETGILFPLTIGQDVCPNHAAFLAAEEEMEQYHLGWYKARQGFDPNGLIKVPYDGTFRHVPTIEDFWANATDDFHVRKLAFSRLSVDMMRTIRWRGLDIPDQLKDDDNVLREDFEEVENTELSPVDWDDHQDPSLEAVTRSVDLHTEAWYNERLRQLQSWGVPLTYELMRPEAVPTESVGQKGEGSGHRQQTVEKKKRALESEKGKERDGPPAKKQNKIPSRESVMEARAQKISVGEQGAAAEVSSDSESSGYSMSTEYSPVSVDERAVDGKSDSGPVDVEAMSQVPDAGGDALMVEPNPDLGRCNAPLWLRQLLMPRGEVAAIQTPEEIQGTADKEDRQKRAAETVARVIRDSSDGYRKVQIAVPRIGKALEEMALQDYDVVEHNLGRITDDMECEEVQEGVASIKERLRKANERIKRLEAENRYWRDSQPIQQLQQAALPQHSGSNTEDASAQLNEVRRWISNVVRNGKEFLPSFVSTFQSLLAVRNRFRAFEAEWEDFLPVRDLTIPRLQAVLKLPDEFLERNGLIKEGRKCTVEFWFAALTIRVRILGEIHEEIVRHHPSVEDSIASMLHDVGNAFGFEEITEEKINGTELGSKLDEMSKMDIIEENLNLLASLGAYTGLVEEIRVEHEKTLQAASDMMDTAELRKTHTPCPPMKEIGNMLTNFIALAKKAKKKGRTILEDHLM